MVIPIYFAFLFLWTAEDVVSGEEMHCLREVFTVGLGDSLVLNCTYNCSSAFIRGCWNKEIGNPHCHTGQGNTNGFCTISLHLFNVTVADFTRKYKCYTVQTDDRHLSQETQCIVSLQLQNGTYHHDSNEVRGISTSAAHPAKPTVPTEDEFVFGESTRINALAVVSVFVATVLAALVVYLCVKQSRRIWHDKERKAGSRSCSPLPTDTVHLSMKDGNSDADVPYADIVITVRGVSTPELTQVDYLPVGDHKQRWGMDSRCHLQASRSADRLHIPPPREVSRKMSTGSEYAVISYD